MQDHITKNFLVTAKKLSQLSPRRLIGIPKNYLNRAQ